MDAWEIIKAHQGVPSVHSNAYFSEWYGKVQYNEYNAKRMDYEGFRDVLKAEEEKHVLIAKAMFGDIVEVI